MTIECLDNRFLEQNRDIYVFNTICKKYEGRGAVRQNKANHRLAQQPRSHIQPSSAAGCRPAVAHQPMTLQQFEQSFYARFPRSTPSAILYANATTSRAANTANLIRHNISDQKLCPPPAQSRAPIRCASPTYQNRRNTAIQRRPSVQRRDIATASFRKPECITRRAVSVNLKESSLTNSIKNIPFSMIAVIFVCMLSLLFVVSSSIAASDMRSEYKEIQKAVSELAMSEQAFELQLQAKTDLREIQEVASNELGMVKESFIDKNYIGIEHAATIEAFQEPDTPIGVISLLSAIAKGAR